MKKGANISDQKRIAYWYTQGGTAEQISRKMKIDLKCVKSFEPEIVKEAKKKSKAKNKKSKSDHTAIMDAKTTPAIDPTSPPPKSE